jgi:UDP-3-O-[3-hydroxymyristoyl] glucosamine N-acyltransferase
MKTQEIADFLSGELIGDGRIEIERVAALDRATKGEIVFVEKVDAEISGHASCLIVPLNFVSETSIPHIKVPDPKLAFSLLAAKIHAPDRPPPMIHQSALVRESASVSAGAFIGPFVCIDENTKVGFGTEIRAGSIVGKNVSIGENCTIHFNVVIDDDISIGDNVILHSGVVIGADGFGYVRDDVGEYHQFPQIGKVVIEDNVEIGANSCIDRGALGETRIGRGTKIDNLVQIAHNVQIGKRVVIAAQTGISGSTVIEDDCVIGGQVGMGDHALVRSGAIIGSQAGVLPGKIVRPGVWWGTPIQPLDEYKRQNAMVKGLDRLRAEVKRLNKIVLDLVSKNGGE